MAVNKQIWIDQIIENPIARASFMDFAQNMDEHVENGTINLAEAGVDPEVLVNNAVWPIPIETREDTPVAISMDTFDTKNTVVRNVEAMEASYNKMESVVRGHRRSLENQSMRRAAHAYAPQADSANSPIILASGALNANTGRKILTWDDIARGAAKMAQLFATNQLIAVLNPQHLVDLRNQDRAFNKEFANLKTGQLLEREGFIFMQYAGTPTYAADNTKKAYGAAAAGTDCYGSFFFVQDEVMKAEGEYDMFLTEKDPGARGDIVGFQKRFKALPLRNKFIGAWVSNS